MNFRDRLPLPLKIDLMCSRTSYVSYSKLSKAVSAAHVDKWIGIRFQSFFGKLRRAKRNQSRNRCGNHRCRPRENVYELYLTSECFPSSPASCKSRQNKYDTNQYAA